MKTRNGGGRSSFSFYLRENGISRSPVALFVILGGLALDSIIRLFLTLSSSYFRLISLPEGNLWFLWRDHRPAGPGRIAHRSPNGNANSLPRIILCSP